MRPEFADIFPPPRPHLKVYKVKERPQPITKLRLKLLEDGRPQWVIAKEAGVPANKLSSASLGKYRLTNEQLMSLARVMRCHLGELIGAPDYDLEDI